MPTYEYRCESCGHQVEVFAKMSDPAPTECVECGAAELTRVLFPVAVQYKGTGFYSTDYGSRRSGPSTGGSEGGGSDAAPASTVGESSSTSASAGSESTSSSGNSDSKN